jgi:hypothetical protein
MSKFGISIVTFVGLLLAVFWGIVIRDVLTEEVGDQGWLGVVILALGVFLAVFHRSIGRKVHAKSLSVKIFSTDSFWTKFGVADAQKLYLVIGIMTAIAGGIILFR